MGVCHKQAAVEQEIHGSQIRELLSKHQNDVILASNEKHALTPTNLAQMTKSWPRTSPPKCLGKLFKMEEGFKV